MRNCFCNKHCNLVSHHIPAQLNTPPGLLSERISTTMKHQRDITVKVKAESYETGVSLFGLWYLECDSGAVRETNYGAAQVCIHVHSM